MYLKKILRLVSIRSWIQKVDHELEFPFSQQLHIRLVRRKMSLIGGFILIRMNICFPINIIPLESLFLICGKKKRYSLRFVREYSIFVHADRDVREVFEWGYDTTVPPKSIVKTPIKWVDTSSPYQPFI